MSDHRYPNESPEYRTARDKLLEEEKALVEKVKLVAEKRRQLPPGGKLKEDYTFQWAIDGKVGQEVKFSELFGDKQTLLLYNFMYGPSWDNPCPSCTSLMDGFDRTAYQVTQNAAFCGIAKAPAENINKWAKTRGWSQIDLVSGYGTTYQADYKCQGDGEDMQWPILHVFKKQDGEIFPFWAIAPARVPMGMPSAVENPMVVAALRPSWTAHRLAPLPRCMTISRGGRGAPVAAGHALTMYSYDRPWKP